MLATVALAVRVLPFRPNVRLFEFEKTTWPSATLVVPAEIEPAAAPAATLAVRVEPFRPKVTPFALLKVRAERLLLVVPALKLILPCEDATVTLAVMALPADVPKLTPFAFENDKVWKVKPPLPAVIC